MVQIILDWSEVWALFLPLVAYQLRPQQPIYFRPVLVYLWFALIINFFGDVIGDFKAHLPGWMQTNLVLYSLHSMVRFICFAWLFALISQTHFTRLRQLLHVLCGLLVVINYLYLEDYFDQNHLSGNLFTIEAYFLLIYCLLYYLSQLRDDIESLQEGKEFWIITGLGIYVVINFFIFLFYVPMFRQDPTLAERMWSVHNVAYIILCLFITKAIYVPVRPKP